jgi:trimeric autotransporter adhesin
MKTKLFLSTLLSFVFCLLSSQVPQGFNYQAIARNANGLPIASQNIPVRISIVTTLTGGTVVWQEEFSSVTTDAYGLISLVVGTGTQTGGSATSFTAIDWRAQTLFLKTEVKYPGPDWTILGTSKIWATPYSLVAKDVEGPISKLGITGTTTSMEEALFEVKNQAGNTVFAVYNEGIRAYVGNGDAKGKKGGFSIGGYDATKGSGIIYNLFTLNADSARIYVDSKPNLKGARGGFSVGGYDMTKGGVPVQNYLDVSADSVRIFIDHGLKGAKGGFAVGSFNTTKTSPPDYLRVTRDSTRVTVNRLVGKGPRGGFAVGGYDATKNTEPSSYMSLTPENYFIGDYTGTKINTGKFNSVFGYSAGQNLTDGNSNIFIGYKAGLTNTVGESNIFVGNSSGFSNLNGTSNIFLGDFSGKSNTGGKFNSMGSNNIFLGQGSGYNNTEGGSNIFIGTAAGMKNVDGNLNIYIGYRSGLNLQGVRNTFIGVSTGESSTEGDDNILIGNQTGQFSTTGSSNTMIGSLAGWNIGAGGNNTFVGRSAGSSIVDGNYNVIVGSSTFGDSTGNRNVKIGYLAGGSNGVEGSILIGFEAGMEEENSNRLYISNTGTGPHDALIYGEFDNKILGFNANVGIGTTSTGYKLQVGDAGDGSEARANAWNLLSDVRLKTNFEEIIDPLRMVSSLRGFYFNWNVGTDKSRQLGLSAQDVEKVLPEIVSKGNDGYLSVEYGKLTPVLVEAIKEQQKQISSQQQQIESTKLENQQLKSELNELKTLVNSLIANQTAQVNK